MNNENRMETEPIPKVMLTMAFPMIFSYFVNAIYNVIDSLFVSHLPDVYGIQNVSDKAVTALSLAYPVQMLVIAFGVGIGVGVNASLSKYLGAHDNDKASRVAGNAMFLSICCYICMLIFGLFGIKKYMQYQVADEATFQMGVEYLKIISICSFGTIGAMCFEKLLQAAGRTKVIMIGQLIGSTINIILDPILIFDWFGLPQLGVKGAAIATIAGQSSSFVLAAVFHFRYNDEITNKMSMIKPDGKIIKEVLCVGVPAGAIQAMSAILLFGMNIMLSKISVFAVTAYGIYYKLEKFVLLPALGLNNASVPLIAFNYGAKSRSRVLLAVKSGIIYVVILMLVSTVVFHVFSDPFLLFFAVSEAAKKICKTAIKTISLGFVFFGMNIILQGVCQALGNGNYSFVISLLRYIVVLFPLVKVLSYMPNPMYEVWCAFPAAEIIAFIVAIILTRKEIKKKL